MPWAEEDPPELPKGQAHFSSPEPEEKGVYTAFRACSTQKHNLNHRHLQQVVLYRNGSQFLHQLEPGDN